MGHSNHTAQKKGRGIDAIMLIVMAALFAVLIMEIPVGNGSSVALSSESAVSPLITEFMPSNKGTVTSEDGRYCDWIELCNPTGRPINLAGFALTDNAKMPTKYVLPYRVLEPGEYAVIYADGQPSTTTELHAPFKLKNASEMLLLVNTDGSELQRISYAAMESDQSFAMDMDTQAWAATDQPTPCFPNTGAGYASFLENRQAVSPVSISEVMACNVVTLRDEDGDYPDWVELYNPSAESVDLTGWGLSNNEARPKEWEFPAVEIGPGEHIVVYLSGKNRAQPEKNLHTDFRLDAFHDTLLLSNLRGQIVREVQIDDLKGDASYGLVPGTDTWQAFSQPTPGYPNNQDGWNAFQKSLYADENSPVIISEVMSNNIETLEDEYGEYPDWIELYNRSDRDVDLSGWGLTDDTDGLGLWRFPSTVLSPGEYLAVYASGRDSTGSKKKLHTNFNLSAEGDLAVLTDADGCVSDCCYMPPMRWGLSYQRQPGSLCFSFCDDPTPGKANAAGYADSAAAPTFSLPAGMYDDACEIALTADPGTRICYTLDGATPTEDSTLYRGPIPVATTTVIRAIAYRDGYLPSNPVCATYLIGEDIQIPVVSIVTDPANLFDEETGIYADGPGWTPEKPHYGANYWQDWERPAHMELIEPDGTVGISQGIGLKIFGGCSRAEEQKSFSLMSRSQYGNDTFDYPVFPDLPYTSYKDLIIRNPEDNGYSYIRGKLQIDLAVENADVDGQAHRQTILFLNGEFWGIYDLMEKLNEHFIAQHHDVNPDKIDLLVYNGDVVMGSNADYLALIEFVKTHDLFCQENYDYVASQVDIDNYIDWCAIEIFVGNDDLPNTKFWRAQTPGGKWRWILYDLDWGYLHLHQRKYASRMDLFNLFLDPKGAGAMDRTDNTLIRGLLENEAFKQRFIERFVYHCTVTFNPDKVLQRIDELAANIEPYMQRNLDKWGRSTMDAWRNENLQLVKDYAVERPAINLHYMQEYFQLSDTQMDQLLSQQEINHE